MATSATALGSVPTLVELMIAMGLAGTVLAAGLSLLSQGDVLTGCDNYDPALGVMDPSKAATGFTYCATGATLYRHPLSTCPPMVLPVCGSSGGLPVVASVSHAAGAAAYFSRPSPGEVRFAGRTTASGQAQSVDVAVVFNAAAGTNQ